jgi:hypothetical protein
MAEERIVTSETPGSAPQATHTTVIHDSGRSGGGSGWFIGLVLVLALIAGAYFLTRMSGSETAKDNAIANAAGDVGSAAKEVGSAARDAADKIPDK